MSAIAADQQRFIDRVKPPYPSKSHGLVERFAAGFYEAHSDEGRSAMTDYVEANADGIGSDLTTTDNELLIRNAQKIRQQLWDAAAKAEGRGR